MTEPTPIPAPDLLAAPAAYPFPPGTPDRVPADFEQERAQAFADMLTPEEVAEFRALRAEKKARDEQAAEDAAEAAAKLTPPTHHVHLADGSQVEGSTIESHWATADGRLVPVMSAYPKAEYVTTIS
jgi:hypothetical protein